VKLFISFVVYYTFYNLGLIIHVRKTDFRGCMLYRIGKYIPSLRRYLRYVYLTNDVITFILINDVITFILINDVITFILINDVITFIVMIVYRSCRSAGNRFAGFNNIVKDLE